ncbi:type II secretion system F family protein [Aeromicrobium sp.]|uniref:type II secretion system F family protein n=1 Tax=Aeromicrobium sp. TaxID=1871063 RepID=UPI0025C4B3A3|nr:type II secretion system F family protein [Aeromicrobium sp.]MCK5890075.1 type II secretion system F family protein [Aeromicrobium sp.]
MLVVLALLLIIGALTSFWIGLSGGPVRRVDRQRVAAYAVVEQPTVLNRVATAVEGKVDTAMKQSGGRLFTAEELAMAGIAMPVPSLVVLMGCGAVVAIAAGLLLLGSIVIGVLLAAAVPIMTKIAVRWRTARVRRRFSDQLPGTLQMMAASLRAGHSFPRALDAVAKESDAPMGPELARVVNETRVGRDILVSLDEVAMRMQSEDFRWVGAAIGAQRETGGNLNEILDQVAATIRDRQHVRMQVISLSAEGRLSAMILMALPVLIGGYYTLVAGDQMAVFIDSGIGKLLLAGSLVAYVLGGFWMRSIVRIEF